MPAGASSVQLVIKDSSGSTVRTQALDNSKGQQAFSWDGKTDSGAAAAAGAYKIEVVAKVGTQSQSLATNVAAYVGSVAIDPSTGSLMLDTDTLGDVALSSVERVL